MPRGNGTGPGGQGPGTGGGMRGKGGKGRGQAGGGKARALVHTGGGHHLWVDEDDVGHGDEGGQACHEFAGDTGTVRLQPEQAFQQCLHE